MRRSQAIVKRVTLADYVFDAVRSVRETVGDTGSVVLGIVVVFCILGGINHFAGNNDRDELVSSIPDGISAECHAKLLSIYYSSTSADRIDNADSASNSSSVACGDIGTVK